MQSTLSAGWPANATRWANHLAELWKSIDAWNYADAFSEAESHWCYLAGDDPFLTKLMAAISAFINRRNAS
jgi:hypothetical protein